MSKNLTRRSLGMLAGASIAMSSMAGPVLSDTTELIFNVFIPQQAPLYKNVLLPWAKQIEQDSEGELTISVPTSSLAPPNRQFDIVEDGVADISMSALTFRAKQLGLYQIAAIPMAAPNGKGAATALWKTHESHLDDLDLWGDVVPLAVFTLGTTVLLSNTKPLQSAADLDGYKMMTPVRDEAKIYQNLGAVPVGAPAVKMFEMVSGGVANGVPSALGTAANLGMLEATKYVTTFPGGTGRNVFAIMIGRDRFDGLSEKAQAAILKNSGLEYSVKLGSVGDRLDKVGADRFAKAGVEISQASEAFIAEFAEASSYLADDWMAAASQSGLDGEAILAEFRANAGN